MNIISNVCNGAFLYNKMNIQFNNPFMWSVLFYKDLKELCTNFDNIDFKTAIPIPGIHAKGTCSMNIDNDKLFIRYIHYYQNSSCKMPMKIGPNIHYCKIWEYTYLKYITRVERMLNSKEDPVFLIMDRKDDLNIENTQNLINTTKYKIILFTNYNYKITNDKVKLIKADLTDNQLYNFEPKDFIDNYYNEILRDL